LLHHADIKVDPVGEYDHTPLHIAAEKGDEEMLSQLLRYKANTKNLDVYGNTPLHLACKNGHRECVEVLIKYKSPLDAQNSQGLCALHFCVMRASMMPPAKPPDADADAEPLTPEEAREAHEEEVLALCDLLLDADGSDDYLDCQDQVGRTPLHLACSVTPGHEELVMALLDKGASLSVERRDGKSPFAVAEKVNDAKIMAALNEFLSEQDGAADDFEAIMGGVK
jgi:serine/threonine-protein phosphatase 6 regulatory ankyrin repeat subunit B